MRLIPTFCISALVCAFAAGALQAAPMPDTLVALPRTAPTPEGRELRVYSERLDSFARGHSQQTRFGALDWVGGLELSADDDRFGGFSGIAFVDDSAFLAVSDRGTVLSAKLFTENGHPSGITGAYLAEIPIAPSTERRYLDTEGLAIDAAHAFVSHEGGDPRVTRYKRDGNRITALEGRYRFGAGVIDATENNRGLEALAMAPIGSRYFGDFVIISEDARDGRINGWIEKGKRSLPFHFPQSNGLLVTDADFTKDGDLLVLERNFSLLGGLRIQIRRIRAENFGPGVIDQVDLLFSASLLQEVDNLEGMDVRPQADGSSLITLISDDNFLSLQRTLLLQFRLPADR